MSRWSPIIRLFSPLALALLLVGIVGCSGSAGDRPAANTHPLLRKAEQRHRARDVDGAIALCQRALAEQPGLSAAHLKLALIFDDHKRDYIRAIHHYERYLELNPDSERRDLIEGSIRHCRISFAATMKEAEGDKLDLIRDLRKEIDFLKERNEELGKTVARLRAGAVGADPARSLVVSPAGSTPSGREVVLPVAGSTEAPAAVPAPARTYTVKSGDTLSTISRKVYGSSSRWKEIYEANRDAMDNQNDLRIGQKLNIP